MPLNSYITRRLCVPKNISVIKLIGKKKIMKIYIAIPAMNELDYLPKLIGDLSRQTHTDSIIFICVNNPDEWWSDPEKTEVCKNNSETLDFLRKISWLDIRVIDRSSQGKGWSGKQRGVGYARKELFEAIDREAGDNDIVISIDADTRIRHGFVKSVVESFDVHKNALLLSNPYYHELTGNEAGDRAILRYELYMRYYLINLMKINSPYAFTALGSAISFRMSGYRKISGITPKEAGEDFYFVNRMRKAGEILIWNKECVYPSARESDRVPFGTGPAVTKGLAGDWESYPFYDTEAFSRIGETYRLFPELFRHHLETPVDDFISDNFGENIWEPLRKNFKTEKLFVRACHEKIDGLRILQILKFYQKGNSLKNFVKFSREELSIDIPDNFTFENISVDELNSIRDAYYEHESALRQENEGN